MINPTSNFIPSSPLMIFIKSLGIVPIFYPLLTMYFILAHLYSATNNSEKAKHYFIKLDEITDSLLFISLFIYFLTIILIF